MTNNKTTPSENLNFEQQLIELEGIVSAMEHGDMNLDDSLNAYEKGIQLTRSCQQTLNQAQQRIAVLTKKGSELIETPFNAPEEGNS